MNFRIILLSLFFGILIVLIDLSDAFPLDKSVGNLDHLLGSTFWHPLEIFYPLALIVVFFLFGKSSFNMGRKEIVNGKTSDALKTQAVSSFATNIRIVVPIVFLGLLLILIDLDDILKVLGVSSALRVSSQSPYYWLPIELAIFPMGAIIVFLAFGKMCFDRGKMSSGGGK